MSKTNGSYKAYIYWSRREPGPRDKSAGLIFFGNSDVTREKLAEFEREYGAEYIFRRIDIDEAERIKKEWNGGEK